MKSISEILGGNTVTATTVHQHTMTTKTGKVVTVAEHEDSRNEAQRLSTVAAESVHSGGVGAGTR